MKKKLVSSLIVFLTIFLILLGSVNLFTKNEEKKTHKLVATVLKKTDKKLTVQDENNVIYTFLSNHEDILLGDKIIIEYTGVLNKNKELQSSKVIKYLMTKDVMNEDDIPTEWDDKGIFKDYYKLAKDFVNSMSLEEKIAQLLLVKYPTKNQKELLQKNTFAGYIFFEKDFTNKNKDEVLAMMSDLQESSKIPILTAVDEEGGKVVRLSNNKKLRNQPFAAPAELYKEGGLDLIKEDTITKSKFLNDLGINLNLAPVVDVSNSEDYYIFDRTLQEDTEKTSQYAEAVISASKNTGVSYTLKHFPGYGNNDDTHDGIVTDSRTLEEIKRKDIPPFEAGIKAKAEAILVNHNIISNIDKSNPATLSASVHNLLRNDLKFTGIVITDDMDMEAVKNIDKKFVKALLAGNDLIITGNYEEAITEIKQGLENKEITENLITKLAFRVIAWKYYKGLMFGIHK